MSEENTISREDLDKVKEIIEESVTEEDKLVASLPSNNGIEESDQSIEPETENATVVVDPNTGGNYIANERETEENSILRYDEDLLKMLSLEADDVYEVPSSLADVEVDDYLIIQNAEKNGINIKMITEMLPLLKKYRNCEDKDKEDWYSELPKPIQDMINKECAEINNTSKAAKNIFATELLENVIRDAKMDRIVMDLQEAVNKAYDMTPLMEMVIDQQKTLFEVNLQKTIDALKDKLEVAEEDKREGMGKKIKQLEGVIAAYKESYTLTKLYDLVSRGKIRVKPFDIRKFKRFRTDFLIKYETDTPFVIHDVAKILPTLKRQLGNKYSDNAFIAFAIAFIKQTQNMNSKDVIDHTYMSYFISNIINLDIIGVKEEQEAFSNILINNISKILDCFSSL